MPPTGDPSREECNLHQSVWDNIAAKIHQEDENAASKFWAWSVKEEKKPRDTILELKTLDSPDDQPMFEPCSEKMADLVKNYYEFLQSADLAPREYQG